MKALKCDVCGKLFERSYVPNVAIFTYYHGFGDTRLDLCDDCQNKLLEWIGYKKAGTEETNEGNTEQETG